MIKTRGAVVIGLDGATFDLLDPWFAQGELPRLSWFRKEGCSGVLHTVPNLHSAAAWTSLVTGKNPGKHGIFFFVERDHDFRQRFFSGADRKADALWHILSRAGKRVGVINVPMTFPAEPVNGVMVSGIDAPSIRHKKSIYPPELKHRYDILQKRYDIVPAVDILMKRDDVESAVRGWLEVTEHRLELCRQLLRDQTFDFFMVTLLITDWAHHNLWKYYDPSSPAEVQADLSTRRDIMLDIYRAVDGAVGELCDLAGKDANILIVSDHGAGRYQGGSMALMGWLEQNGYLVFRQRRRLADLQEGFREHVFSPLKERLPQGLKRIIKSSFPHVWKEPQVRTAQGGFEEIDWTRTRAYTESRWHNVWINVKNHGGRGIVNPGPEYRGLLEELKAALLNWRDAPSSRRVVDRVLFRSEIYSGPYADRAPDIQIWWNDDVCLASPKRPKETGGPNAWSGDHRRNGIFMAKGPDVRAGEALGPLSIYDVAPTILHLFGLPLPPDMDGRAILEALFQEGCAQGC
jgi:predicted AlkP superfamily phosphohydrolase/phosphomutase